MYLIFSKDIFYFSHSDCLLVMANHLLRGDIWNELTFWRTNTVVIRGRPKSHPSPDLVAVISFLSKKWLLSSQR